MRRPRAAHPLALSLKSITLIVFLIAAGLGWATGRLRQERRAVRAIEAVGGHVYYDWEWRDGDHIDQEKVPRWRAWLARRVSPDAFGHVVAVEFYRLPRQEADPLMAHLGRLPGLVELTAYQSRVTGEGLAHIGGLRGLKTLHLGDTAIRGRDLVHLAGMSQLEVLSIPPGILVDDDLIHLSKLTGLRELAIRGGHVTDAGLSHLDGLRSLESLELTVTLVTSLGPLRGMARLQYLWVNRSPVDDAGLAPIAGLPVLRDLRLDDCRLTDAGLAHLASLPALQILGLDHMPITDAGAAKLAGLPHLGGIGLRGTLVSDRWLETLIGRAYPMGWRSFDLTASKVSRAGVDALRACFPTMHVVGP